jgi:hypothetical protein
VANTDDVHETISAYQAMASAYAKHHEDFLLADEEYHSISTRLTRMAVELSTANSDERRRALDKQRVVHEERERARRARDQEMVQMDRLRFAAQLHFDLTLAPPVLPR